MGGFLKEIADFRSDFRELDAKVDHILGMIADMQQQLQAQEWTEGKEIRYDGCVAEIQSEQHIIIPITDFDEFVIGENNQIETQQGLSEIPHPIAEFESRSEKLELMHEQNCTTVEEADFSTDETTKMQAQKVFDEMLESEMKVICVTKTETVEMKTEIGESEVQSQQYSCICKATASINVSIPAARSSGYLIRAAQLHRRAVVELRRRTDHRVHDEPQRETGPCSAAARAYGCAHPHVVLHPLRIQIVGHQLSRKHEPSPRVSGRAFDRLH